MTDRPDNRQPIVPVPLLAPAGAPQGGAMQWTIPISISVSLGAPQRVGAVPSAAVAPLAEEGRLFAAPVLEALPPFSREALAADRFGWKTALALALASDLAYSDAATVERTARTVWGLDTCRFIEHNHTQCFVASSPKATLVAFRGTESPRDWLADLNVFSTARSYGTVHAGFRNAFAEVSSPLETLLTTLTASAPQRPILLTGHSLGGAIATIAAAEWRNRFPVAWIYTYGQPAVGRGEFFTFMTQQYGGRFFRIVNDDDIVPRVPPTYRHVGRLFRFNAHGGLPGGLETPMTEAASMMESPVMSEAEFDSLRARLLEQRAQERAAGVTESPESIALEGLFPSFSDHKLANYIAKIAPLAATT